MQLDYINIGKRIKDIRAKRNISQEYLAELADLSIAHTSHIENGSTKASLPALVRIANALEASLDELVCDSLIKAKDVFNNEILQEVKDCNETETRIIADTIKALKASLRKRGQNLSII